MVLAYNGVSKRCTSNGNWCTSRSDCNLIMLKPICPITYEFYSTFSLTQHKRIFNRPFLRRGPGSHTLTQWLVCLFVQVSCRFQQFFSHIMTVSGCDRELNAHFYSATSLKYHAPQTLDMYHIQSHYPDTGSTSPSSTSQV